MGTATGASGIFLVNSFSYSNDLNILFYSGDSDLKPDSCFCSEILFS